MEKREIVEWFKYPSGYYRVWIRGKEQRELIRRPELDTLIKGEGGENGY